VADTGIVTVATEVVDIGEEEEEEVEEEVEEEEEEEAAALAATATVTATTTAVAKENEVHAAGNRQPSRSVGGEGDDEVASGGSGCNDNNITIEARDAEQASECGQRLTGI
jgi:hypothetical protein